MLKTIVNGVEKDIIRIPMIVNGTEKEGWEVRDQNGQILWGRNRTLTGESSINFIGYGIPLCEYMFDGNVTEKDAKPTTNPSSFDPIGFGDKTENYLPSPESETKTQDGITIVCDGNGGYTISRSSGYSTTPTIWFDIQPAQMTGEVTAKVSLFNTASANIAFVAMDSYGSIHDYPLSTEYAVHDIYFMSRRVITKVGFQFTNSDSISTVKLSPQVTDSQRNTYIPYGYVIPLSIGAQTKNIYLKSPCYKLDSNTDRLLKDQVLRKIREYTLTGNESWYMYQESDVLQFYTSGLNLGAVSGSSAMSNIAKYGATTSDRASHQYGCYTVNNGYDIGFQMYGSSSSLQDVTAWKTYLQNSYNRGTPVRFWYVLENAEIESISGPILPTAVGNDTITAGTMVNPTFISITGHIKESV